MSWNNIGAIATDKQWQYTDILTGNLIRVRHEVTADYPLPYGFTGLIAQARFSATQPELFNIRRLYPKPEYDVYQLDRNWTEDIRVAIRGQRKFQTPINWLVKIDVWSSATSPTPDQVITQQQSTGYLIGLI